ncbi:MAG: ferritin family protein [Clostridiaceae bacterium]|nr:ferritin family protein [Clostridiaceae bacterium]
MGEAEHFICRVPVDLPYPQVWTASRNPAYARAMLSNVGSNVSEMTAVSLYFYDSVILNPMYADFARCFEQIGIVEMHHLEMFAELAFQMGGDPRLWSVQNGQMVYWTPAYGTYHQEVKKVICRAINGEKAAVRKYRRQAETIQDTEIVAVLKRIILDEEHHIEIFTQMLTQISGRAKSGPETAATGTEPEDVCG